jgi:hypothetical protein
MVLVRRVVVAMIPTILLVYVHRAQITYSVKHRDSHIQRPWLNLIGVLR